MAEPLEEPTRDRAPGSRRESVRASLTGEVAYVGMLCSTFFLYLSLAMISLAPINTLGKNSPIQVAAYRNDFLRGVIQSLGLDRASLTTLRVSAFVVIGLLMLAYAWAIYIFRNREDKRLGVHPHAGRGHLPVLILYRRPSSAATSSPTSTTARSSPCTAPTPTPRARRSS